MALPPLSHSSRFLRLLRVALLPVPLASCAPSHLRAGDGLAKQGKWEEALVEYKSAAEKKPTNSALKRIAKAEKQISDTYLEKGIQAAKAGSMPEAAEWWKQSFEVRPTATRLRVVISENTSKLETCGSNAARDKKWEDSFRCYEALRIAYPDRMDLAEHIDSGHRELARDLDEQAQALAKRGLVGAALVLEIRTRHHDPLHPSAFARESTYRKTLQTSSLVNVPSVSVEDGGYWALGGYLAPALSARLGEHPPYGPTKKATSAPAVFVATIEDFVWWDDVTHGVSAQEIEKPKTSKSKDKVPNPEHAAWKTLVEELEKQGKALEAAAAKGAAAAPPKKGAKKVTPVARPPTAEQLEWQKTALEDAKTKLATIAETIEPSAAGRTWYLPWKQVRRVVEARVKFELRESDFEEPLTKTVTLSSEATDRAHAAFEEHDMAADALQVPSVEDLTRELAGKLATPGIETLRDARDRRAERWINLGREARLKSEDEALDLYVRAIFARGAEGEALPGDAATIVAIRLERGSFKDILAGP